MKYRRKDVIVFTAPDSHTVDGVIERCPNKLAIVAKLQEAHGLLA